MPSPMRKKFAASSKADGIDLAFDARHIWHPYAALGHTRPIYPVKSALGAHITLQDGRELIDGMASWWCAIHGYRHPAIMAAMQRQLELLPHVMFGGLTHAPAVDLSKALLALLPEPLDAVFYSDSGSVAVEVAMKMALQHAAVRGQPTRRRIAAFRGGYHGDTTGAMSLCDPVNGMHSLFADSILMQPFMARPKAKFGRPLEPAELFEMREFLQTHRDSIAGVIVEPVVQGAGGMWFYAPELLVVLREICDELDILLIFDEIATGFGRTGRAFAMEHAGVVPDIVCLGKALTGGNLSMAVTVARRAVAETLSREGPGVFMHGPTYMGNPLACAAASASLALFAEGHWQAQVANLERWLTQGLAPARELPGVADVRVLGAIGVIELTHPVDMTRAPELFVARGVWVRPFNRLIYVMPPYILSEAQTRSLTEAMCAVAEILGRPQSPGAS